MKYTILSFKSDEETKELLQQIAKEKDMSVSAIIREAIKMYVKELNKNAHIR